MTALKITVVDRAACVAAFGDWELPILKHADDLDRYRHVIAKTRPQVIIETGTRTGHSALFFAAQPGVEHVITIDLDPDQVGADVCAHPAAYRISRIKGSSTDPDVIALVTGLVAGRRALVSLDSDHSSAHVAAEIALYTPLVGSGCHLVVEDGVIAWLDHATITAHGCGIYTGTVLDAIAATLPRDGLIRDIDTETLTPVTMFPAGWWYRL